MSRDYADARRLGPPISDNAALAPVCGLPERRDSSFDPAQQLLLGRGFRGQLAAVDGVDQRLERLSRLFAILVVHDTTLPYRLSHRGEWDICATGANGATARSRTLEASGFRVQLQASCRLHGLHRLHAELIRGKSRPKRPD